MVIYHGNEIDVPWLYHHTNHSNTMVIFPLQKKKTVQKVLWRHYVTMMVSDCNTRLL